MVLLRNNRTNQLLSMSQYLGLGGKDNKFLIVPCTSDSFQRGDQVQLGEGVKSVMYLAAYHNLCNVSMFRRQPLSLVNTPVITVDEQYG